MRAACLVVCRGRMHAWSACGRAASVRSKSEACMHSWTESWRGLLRAFERVHSTTSREGLINHHGASHSPRTTHTQQGPPPFLIRSMTPSFTRSQSLCKFYIVRWGWPMI